MLKLLSSSGLAAFLGNISLPRVLGCTAWDLGLCLLQPRVLNSCERILRSAVFIVSCAMNVHALSPGAQPGLRNLRRPLKLNCCLCIFRFTLPGRKHFRRTAAAGQTSLLAELRGCSSTGLLHCSPTTKRAVPSRPPGPALNKGLGVTARSSMRSSTVSSRASGPFAV